MKPEALPEHLRAALAEIGRRGGRKRMSLLSSAQRSALARRAVQVRDFGWCPHCEVEPATAEHLEVCEAR